MSQLTQWIVREPDPVTVETLAKTLNVPPLVACLLVNRGVTEEAMAQRFLNPRLDDLFDPYLLPDMEKAVSRLSLAIERKERIFIHGDYDADGVTSAALCLRALTALGADVVGHVPKRTDGYDLQKVGVEKARDANAVLILTADCGVCAVEAVAYANSLGMEVIVTDHHRPGPTLPDAVAVVNPYRAEANLPFRDICGAGVAFKVLDALVEHLMPAHRTAFRNNYLDLVALGTVADVTPLVHENRIFVHHGLKTLAQAKKTGIQALLVSLDMVGKPLDAESISFKLGPRLNAAGRVEDAAIAYRLLTTRDPEEAEQLAVQMAALAEKSREETRRVQEDALEMASQPEHTNRRVLVLAKEHWGHGVVGIAATKVVESLQRPAILLSYDKHTDHWGGSARSFGAFNLHTALHACAELLTRFGGHSQAAGVSLPSANLAAFQDKMDALAEGFIDAEPVLPELHIDAEITSGRVLDRATVEAMDCLAPFGRENPEPTFVTHQARLTYARAVGKEGAQLQVRFALPGSSQEFKGIWFWQGKRAESLHAGAIYDIVYTPKINEWNGRVTIDLQMKDIRPAEGEVPPSVE